MERNHIYNSTLKFHENENQLDLPKLVLFAIQVVFAMGVQNLPSRFGVL
jgi:hypothetical protein